MPRTVQSLLFLTLLLLPSLATASTHPRAILISWDGAADWVVDRLLEEGKLPNVARMAASGSRAEACRPAYPSLTAPGHAALWTGAWSDVNGITGNRVPILPRGGHTLLEHRDGFAPESLMAEPLWISAAKAGRKVVLLSATHSQPDDAMTTLMAEAGIPPDRLYTFSGFRCPIAGPKVWRGKELRPASGWTSTPPHLGTPQDFSTTIGLDIFHFLAYDSPHDPTDGLDTLLIRQGSKDADALASATLRAAEAPAISRDMLDATPDAATRFSSRFGVRNEEHSGFTRFRLFSLSPDGEMVLYQRGADGLIGNAPPAELEAYWEAYGGFHDAPFGAYKSGDLGIPLWEGGDGTAERRILEAVRLDCELLTWGTRFAWNRWKPDLMTHYSPMIDTAGHTWMGLLDPDCPGHDTAIAARLWPYYEAVYGMQDRWLGTILDLAGDDTLVGLFSDHGMEGVTKSFAPNAVLEQAGLLATLSNRRIRLDRTRICAPSWSKGFLCLNGTDWLSGIVPPEERESVLRAAEDALLSVHDPETSERIVLLVFRPDRLQGLGMGGPAGGDLYFDLAPGYETVADVTSNIVTADRSLAGRGVHGFFPMRNRMQAICFLSGPGVSEGRTVPPIRQIDIAPTVARLLAFPPPAQATGHIIGEMMSAVK